MTKGKIIVVSAPSGAGKTTLLDHLRSEIPGLFYSVSATTRPPRPHEKNGVHYYFLTREEFRKKIDRNELAEWQEVHGYFYGSPKQAIDDAVNAGRHVIMDIDVYGKKKFDVSYPDAAGILVKPPSMEELERRLRGRGTEREQDVLVRLANARKELDFAETRGKYEYVIVNDSLEWAKQEIVRIVRAVIGLS
jgi:guanylate kinase